MTKEASKPKTSTLTLVLPNTFSTSCRLRIVNGTARGLHRASGVAFVVRTMDDDDAKAGPGRRVRSRLTGDMEVLEMEMVLPSRCTLLDVTVTGPAGATVAFIIDTVSAKPR